MPSQFLYWYPYFYNEVEIYLPKCSAQIQAYNALNMMEILRLQNSPALQLCNDAYNCIVQQFTPAINANVQSASILLGLTVPALAQVGSTAAEIALVSSCRPFLSFLLALGAPVVNVVPLFTYYNPIDTLRPSRDPPIAFPQRPLHQPKLGYLISISEYVLALAAAINTGLQAYDLYSKTNSNVTCTATWNPFVWTYLASFVHLCGIAAFASRVKVTRLPRRDGSGSLSTWLADELRPCAIHQATTFALKPESYLSLFCGWILSLATVLHLIYGISVLSSLAFIQTNDAVVIIVRYFVSTVLCRMILGYELAGLRAAAARGGLTADSKETSVTLGSEPLSLTD